MTTSNFSPIELVDDVYNLAFWMTGDEASAGMLVSQTYTNPRMVCSKQELFRQFRTSYLKSFGQSATFDTQKVAMIPDADIARAVLSLPSDFKLVVLLADAEEMSHAEIAAIVEKPIETVRGWLRWGRKLLYQELGDKVSN